MEILEYKTTYKKIAAMSLLTFALAIPSVKAANAYASVPDSIGIENVQGETYIIHKAEKGDTFYKLSRLYNVNVNHVIKANNNKGISIGMLLKVPTGRPYNNSTSSKSTSNAVSNQNPVLTEYKVGEKETLYAISRRFGVTVDDIKKLNNLTSNNLRNGQILRIPNNEAPAATPVASSPVVISPPPIIVEDEVDSEDTAPVRDLNANRYGLREKKERGIGVWMDGLNADGSSNLALHKTAPIGTILKITNPMTKSVTFAKVVGKFNDNADNENAIVILSKSAAAYIGALDKRFQVEITYGIPLND